MKTSRTHKQRVLPAKGAMKDRKKHGRKRKSTALEADEPEADMEAESEVAHAAKEVITGKRKHGRKRKSAVLEADEPEPEPEPVSWLGSTSVIWTSRDTYPDPSTQWPSSTDFHSLQCPLLAPCSIRHHTGEPVGHFEHNRSYSNILLSHASLYVSGDFWLIDELKALAIYKLHKTLYIFELDDQKVTDIVDLARYAYEEEGKGSDDGIGRLRGIVCQYIALHATELSVHAVFMDIIGEGGLFARDFVKFAVQRMQ